MGHILRKKIKIKKPVIFICGPYCRKSDTSNRRNILQNRIYEVYRDAGKEVIPLIVDEFLDEDHVETSEFSVQLMEEICAAISCETLIFLDTMSAATELGAFSNSSYSNTIRVYVPKKSDIYNQGNIGYYVEHAVLNNLNSHIKTITYRPRIQLASTSSDYFSEYYYFIGDVVPHNIEVDLQQTVFENVSKLESSVEYVQATKESNDYNIIGYSVEGKTITFTLSIRLLFYIVVSIMQAKYPSIVSSSAKLEFNKIDLKDIAKKAKKTILDSFSIEACKDVKSFKVNMVTVCKCDYLDLIKHMAKFVHVYYSNSQYKSIRLLGGSDRLLEKYKLKNHPDVCFSLSEEDLELCKAISEDSDKFFEKVIIKAKKKREIIKYKDSDDGNKARQLHEKIRKSFSKAYKPSEHSYAYIEKRSIKSCVTKHLENRGFVKVDIKKFFNSITKDNLIDALLHYFNIDVKFKHRVDDIINSCFYDGKLPLGLCCSPIFSDCYLNAFDHKMEEFANNNHFVYTRYADDIMLSKTTAIDTDDEKSVLSFVSERLKEIGLKMNDEKTQTINFDKSHHFMRYVGVNIVEDRAGKSNYLSVGNTYIHDLAKELIEYKNSNQNNSSTDEEDKSLFYKKVEVIGKIGFIKQIEGERGIKRLRARLRKYYPDIDFYDI